jgi:hypothetical protein
MRVSQITYATCSGIDGYQTHTALNDPNLNISEGNPLALGAGTKRGLVAKGLITTGVVWLFNRMFNNESVEAAPKIALGMQAAMAGVQCGVVEANRRTLQDVRQ